MSTCNMFNVRMIDKNRLVMSLVVCYHVHQMSACLDCEAIHICNFKPFDDVTAISCTSAAV